LLDAHSHRRRSVGQNPQNNTFIVSPTFEEPATFDGEHIVVKGDGLDASDCSGAQPSFKLLNGSKPFKLTKEDTSTATEVKLKPPTTAKGVDATWKVQVQFGDKVRLLPLQIKSP
jgi:hypothetical protein